MKYHLINLELCGFKPIFGRQERDFNRRSRASPTLHAFYKRHKRIIPHTINHSSVELNLILLDEIVLEEFYYNVL